MALSGKARWLLAALMILLIVAGAVLFFVIGTTATRVFEDNLPKPTPTLRPLRVYFGNLTANSLDAGNLRKVADFVEPHGLGIFDGTLYVSDWGEDKLYAVDPTTGNKRLLADELGGAHDMVLDADGWIVTPLYKEDRVVRVNRQSGAVEELATGFSGPNGIAKARSGNYYISNNKDGTVVKLSPDGKQKRVIARGLKQPAGVVVDNDNIVRVAQYADPNNPVVQIFDDGKQSTIVKDDLPLAESLLYDERKNLLISHGAAGQGTISMFTARGSVVRILTTNLPPPVVGPVTDGTYLYLESAAKGRTGVYRIKLP
jgi:sugar lactone lactonase YvrE